MKCPTSFLAIICILLVVSFTVPADADINQTQFYSQALKQNRTIAIYYPPDYNNDSSQTFPVVYFLQGTGNFSEYQAMFSDINLFLDFAIVTKEVNSTVVVIPDGTSGLPYPFVADEWTNSGLLGLWEDYFIKDVVSFVESSVPKVQTYRGGRFLLGISMGGYSAMRFAITYPDAFGAVASLSGFFDIEPLLNLWRPEIIKEQKDNGGKFNPVAGRYSQLIYSDAATWTPVLGCNESGYQVDLPYNPSTLELNYSVIMQWVARDVMSLLQENIAEVRKWLPGIYFDVGTEDEYFFPAANAPFDEALNMYEIRHTFETFKGGHMNKLMERLPIGSKFLSRHFNPHDTHKGDLSKTSAPTGRNCSQPLPSPPSVADFN